MAWPPGRPSPGHGDVREDGGMGSCRPSAAPREGCAVPHAGSLVAFSLGLLQVRAAERHGGALSRRFWCLRRGGGGASPPLRLGLCRRSHGLRGDG